MVMAVVAVVAHHADEDRGEEHEDERLEEGDEELEDGDGDGRDDCNNCNNDH